MKLRDDLVARAEALVADRLGLDFPGGRRSDLAGALTTLSRAVSDVAFDRWLGRLEAAPDDSLAWRAVTSALTVHETYFFRDHALFAALEHQILPALIAERRASGLRRLRLWSAGCATGEEPYSLAIILHRLLPDLGQWSVSILGTDVDRESLAAATRGVFRPWSLRATPADVRAACFRPRGDGTLQLIDAIRRLVTFTPLNLAAPRPPWPDDVTTDVDVLLCRNVLMYLRRDTQQAVVGRLVGALHPGGWLAVAPAEAAADLLAPLRPAPLDGVVIHRPPRRGEVDASVGGMPPEVAGGVMLPSREPMLARPLTALVRSRERGHLPTPEERIALARMLADQGRLDEADEHCRVLLAAAGPSLDALLLAAAVALERGELDAALAALRRAIYLDAESVAAHLLLATVLHRRGRPRAAGRAMQVAARLARARPADEAVRGTDGVAAGVLALRLGACLGRAGA